MRNQAEVAREVLERVNRAPYTITNPHPESQLASLNPKWFVACLDGAYYGATAHAKSAWADINGEVWVDSANFDVIDWIEEAYGEKGAIKAMALDYMGVSLDQVESKLSEFPWVTDRIRTYRSVLDENVRPLTGVKLEMACSGGKGACWLLFRGQVGWDPSKRFKTSLRKTVEALRLAYKMTEQEPAYRR